MQQRSAHNAIEAPIAQRHTTVAYLRLQIIATRFPLEPANLIDVSEIRGELHCDGHIGWLDPVVLDPQFLVANALPQKFLQPKMQGAERQVHAISPAKIGVGECDR
jgi:hypothetical protein